MNIRIIRGGSWINSPERLRPAYRDWFGLGLRSSVLGFRIVEDIGDDFSRVIRGGSWYSFPRLLRSANRVGDLPDGRSCFQGFRVVENLR